MTWHKICLKQTICERQEIEPYLWQLTKVFWRFSQFHGQYRSLPPPQCNQNITQSKQQKGD
ncbi:MAG: hypothetical protein ACTS2F_14710 [Thainema sp.]